MAGAVGYETGIIDTQANTVTLNGELRGINTTGTFMKYGTGLLVLNQNNSYLGSTVVAAGTVRVNNNTPGNLAGPSFMVLNQARLEGTGSVGVVATVVSNAGIIEPGSPNHIHGTLTIGGSYAGQPGGKLVFNTELGNDSSLTSKLIIKNGTGYIPNSVEVLNHWVVGDHTKNGIPIIQVERNSNPTAFVLDYDYIRPDGTPTVIGAATTSIISSTRPRRRHFRDLGVAQPPQPGRHPGDQPEHPGL